MKGSGRTTVWTTKATICIIMCPGPVKKMPLKYIHTEKDINIVFGRRRSIFRVKSQQEGCYSGCVRHISGIWSAYLPERTFLSCREPRFVYRLPCLRTVASLDFEIIEFKHQFCGNIHTHTHTHTHGQTTIPSAHAGEGNNMSILILRPLTRGKHFLLFLPDSHSAYYDSFVSALGQSLPPSLGLSRICCTWSSFWRERWVGRWVVGSLTRACNTG